MKVANVGGYFQKSRVSAKKIISKCVDGVSKKESRKNILICAAAVLTVVPASLIGEALSKKAITRIASDLFEKTNIVKEINQSKVEKFKGGTADFLKESAKGAKKNFVKIAK